MKIILASASLGRRKILEELGLKFKIVPANIDEEKFTAKSPIALVKKIAKAKILAVLKGSTLYKVEPYQNYLIIAADSMVLFGGKLYGKPKSVNDAKRLLTMLSGQTHDFITGLVIIYTKTNKIYQSSCKTKVIFEKFTEKEIDDFIKIADVTSFAGAYTYELKGGEILRPKMRIIGSETNMAGLPLEKLLPLLNLASKGLTF